MGRRPQDGAAARAAGFATLGDLAAAEPAALATLLGEAGASHMGPLARGIDTRAVEPQRTALTIGAEETFERDLVERRVLDVRLLDLAGRVARRLLRAGLVCGGLTLKVKYADFKLRSRSAVLPDAVADTASLHDAAKTLLDRVPPGHVRLLGLSATRLSPPPEHAAPTLFVEANTERRRRLEAVVLASGDRFGAQGLMRAALLEEGMPQPDPRVARSPFEAAARGSRGR